jgi:hypothetical protein
MLTYADVRLLQGGGGAGGAEADSNVDPRDMLLQGYRLGGKLNHCLLTKLNERLKRYGRVLSASSVTLITKPLLLLTKPVCGRQLSHAPPCS